MKMDTLTKTRTRNTVDKAFAKTINNKSDARGGYLSCKYNAFSPNNRMSGIPDGRGQRVIVRDFKSAYDIASNVPFQVRVSPTFPTPMRICAPTATSASVVTVNGTTVPLACLSGTVTGQWMSAGPLAGYNQTAGINSNFGQTASARMANVAYRLVYTGAASTASGLIIADSLPEKIDYVVPVPPVNVGFTDNTGSASGTIAMGTANIGYLSVDTITGTAYSGSTPKNQYVGRPENGLHGVLKSRVTAGAHEYKPFYEYGVVPIMSTVPGYTMGAASPATAVAAATALNVWDDGLESVVISITVGGNYRLEIITCMETELSANNGLVDMASPSPPIDRHVLDLDDDISSNNVVIAAPLTTPLYARTVTKSRRRQQILSVPKRSLPAKPKRPRTTRKRKIANPKR
jgi:hypothetical protein